MVPSGGQFSTHIAEAAGPRHGHISLRVDNLDEAPIGDEDAELAQVVRVAGPSPAPGPDHREGERRARRIHVPGELPASGDVDPDRLARLDVGQDLDAQLYLADVPKVARGIDREDVDGT